MKKVSFWGTRAGRNFPWKRANELAADITYDTARIIHLNGSGLPPPPQKTFLIFQVKKVPVHTTLSHVITPFRKAHNHRVAHSKKLLRWALVVWTVTLWCKVMHVQVAMHCGRQHQPNVIKYLIGQFKKVLFQEIHIFPTWICGIC